MPRGGDDQHDDGAGDEAHFPEMAEIPDEQQEDENDGGGENDADESFGEDVEGDGDGECPAGEEGGIAGLPAVEEKVEAEANPETDEKIGNENAREEIGAEGCDEDYRGPESGGGSEEAAACFQEEEGKGENAEALREAGGPFGDAEERKTDGHRPIWDRGFLEIANAVFVERDPVVKREHFAAGFGVGAVGIVEERRMEEAGDEDGEPESENREIRRPVAAGRKVHARTRVETLLDGVGLGASNIF